MSPWLGGRVDRTGRARPGLDGWTIVSVLATAALCFAAPAGSAPALAVYAVSLFAYQAALTFYNALLPGPGELSATLLIEIEDQSRLREELNCLVGIDEHVTLEVGGELRVAATFEAGRQTAEKISAVQYVRFPLEAEGRGRIAAGAPLALAVAHPSYRARTLLPEAVRASLAADLADPAAADRALREVRDGG